MIEQLRFQYSIADDQKVIRLANQLLETEEYKNKYEVLNYKAQAHKNLFQDELAIVTYQRIIESYPDLVEPRLNLGLLLIEVEAYEGARNHLLAALKIDPKNLEVLNNIIFIEEVTLNFEEVIELSNLAIELDPNDPSIWLVISSAHERLGNYVEAIDTCKKGIRLSGDDMIYLQLGYNNLGYIYLKMNDLAKAKTYLEKAIELDDTEPFAFNNLGLVMAKLGDFKQGMKLINHSIQLDNENSYAFKNRAKVHLMEGNAQLAQQDLLRAKDLNYELEYGSEVNELLDSL